jgi:glycosyltransferase involved in cell wall biosynthesis
VDRPLRVLHCPINTAGAPWENVLALRRRGIDAQLVVFERYKLHPEADWSLDRPQSFVGRQLVQWRALAKLLPKFDVFHFYFGLTLVPKSLQFPILRAFRKKSLYHYLGADIRGKTPEQLAYGKRAGAEIVGSYDAARWVPEAHVVPVGIDLRGFTPVPPSDSKRPLIIHAPSNRVKKGTAHVIEACAQLPVDLEIIEGVHHDEARKHYERADIIVDQVFQGWHGVLAIEAMALGKPVLTFLHDEAVRRTEAAFGLKVPVVNANKDTLVEALRPLVESPAERRRVGAEGRAYVEQVHNADRLVDRYLEIYSKL